MNTTRYASLDPPRSRRRRRRRGREPRPLGGLLGLTLASIVGLPAAFLLVVDESRTAGNTDAFVHTSRDQLFLVAFPATATALSVLAVACSIVYLLKGRGMAGIVATLYLALAALIAAVLYLMTSG